MSYNVENLFDTKKDSLTSDGDFTPTGNHYWTYTKYKKKTADIAKTIIALGEWEVPALVALCEIENETVLWDLVRNSPLEKAHYAFVHKDSPDARGIDVALLYQKDKFKLLWEEFLTMKFKTRDILYAAGVVPTGDTLHVFVCHFPSRLGGELESEERRIQTTSALRLKVDSIYNHITKNPNIVIMGDFNDMPDNRSIAQILKAHKPIAPFSEAELYNLAYPVYEKGLGTYKLAGEWNLLDQIIVSGALLDKNNNLYAAQEMQIYSPDFLRETDETKGGFKPFRTFLGQRYIGGVSDHFPVYVDFIMK